MPRDLNWTSRLPLQRCPNVDEYRDSVPLVSLWPLVIGEVTSVEDLHFRVSFTPGMSLRHDSKTADDARADIGLAAAIFDTFLAIQPYASELEKMFDDRTRWRITALLNRYADLPFVSDGESGWRRAQMRLEASNLDHPPLCDLMDGTADTVESSMVEVAYGDGKVGLAAPEGVPADFAVMAYLHGMNAIDEPMLHAFAQVADAEGRRRWRAMAACATTAWRELGLP